MIDDMNDFLFQGEMGNENEVVYELMLPLADRKLP